MKKFVAILTVSLLVGLSDGHKAENVAEQIKVEESSLTEEMRAKKQAYDNYMREKARLEEW